MTELEVRRVSFRYRKAESIFKTLNFHIKADINHGKITAIMGASGCGKTTLLQLISGLKQPQEGEIIFSPHTPVMTFLPQDIVTFEHLSREENVRFYRNLSAHRGNFDEALLQESIEMLGLRPVINSNDSVDKLSGGQKQRLSLARALSIRPNVILLDEPCTGLDTPVKQEFLKQLRELVHRNSILALYVTHHSEEALFVADDILYLWSGKEAQRFGGEETKVTHKSVPDFLRAPPTLEAAIMFAADAISVFDCVIKGDDVRLANDGPIICKCEPTFPQLTECKLAFEANTIIAVNKNGLPVRSISKSGLYFFGRLDHDLAGRREKGAYIMFRHHGASLPSAIGLRGPAIVFRLSGGDGIPVTLNHEGL